MTRAVPRTRFIGPAAFSYAISLSRAARFLSHSFQDSALLVASGFSAMATPNPVRVKSVEQAHSLYQLPPIERNPATNPKHRIEISFVVL